MKLSERRCRILIRLIDLEQAIGESENIDLTSYKVESARHLCRAIRQIIDEDEET